MKNFLDPKEMADIEELKRRKRRKIEENSDCDEKENQEHGLIDQMLPDEMLVKIFHYLPLQSLCKEVSLVSKKWHNLSGDEQLWRPILQNERENCHFNDNDILSERSREITSKDRCIQKMQEREKINAILEMHNQSLRMAFNAIGGKHFAVTKISYDDVKYYGKNLVLFELNSSQLCPHRTQCFVVPRVLFDQLLAVNKNESIEQIMVSANQLAWQSRNISCNLRITSSTEDMLNFIPLLEQEQNLSQYIFKKLPADLKNCWLIRESNSEKGNITISFREENEWKHCRFTSEQEAKIVCQSLTDQHLDFIAPASVEQASTLVGFDPIIRETIKGLNITRSKAGFKY